MNCVERVVYYSDTVDQEPFEPPAVGAVTPPPSWPARGAVEFRDYKMRYRPNTPLVLKGVSFRVRGGEKVGIVGRTGAGKSSIMVSLFRLIANECHSGSILLDEVDVDRIGLSRLRPELAIIPQDPVMFSGTIRSNLDPVGELKAEPGGGDTLLWDVLAKVGLSEVVSRMPGRLDAPVSEFGENLSTGQRQLICLGRVLLRKCKVILMDEASSALDHASDMALQHAIRSTFGGCTVLTIAHRLNTIIASDKVLVLDGGTVAEFAHPHELLSDPSSQFSALVDEMGAETATALRRAAAEAFTDHSRRVDLGSFASARGAQVLAGMDTPTTVEQPLGESSSLLRSSGSAAGRKSGRGKQ